MPDCPICGLEERCRNHWVASQAADGEIEFQIGPMTASEDNLILLRNRLQNPPLRSLFAQLQLEPQWVEDHGRLRAYLHWPLELRGAVNRTLFPQGAPGASLQPLPPTPVFRHELRDLTLHQVGLDLVNCLPDEIIYRADFRLQLAGTGVVGFAYQQLIFAEGMEWARHLRSPQQLAQAQAVLQLLMQGLAGQVRVLFMGQQVELLAENHPGGLSAGSQVDEVVLPGPPESHLGEEIEARINQQRLQPVLRDRFLEIAASALTPIS